MKLSIKLFSLFLACLLFAPSVHAQFPTRIKNAVTRTAKAIVKPFKKTRTNPKMAKAAVVQNPLWDKRTTKPAISSTKNPNSTFYKAPKPNVGVYGKLPDFHDKQLDKKNVYDKVHVKDNPYGQIPPPKAPPMPGNGTKFPKAQTQYGQVPAPKAPPMPGKGPVGGVYGPLPSLDKGTTVNTKAPVGGVYGPLPKLDKTPGATKVPGAGTNKPGTPGATKAPVGGVYGPLPKLDKTPGAPKVPGTGTKKPGTPGAPKAPAGTKKPGTPGATKAPVNATKKPIKKATTPRRGKN